MVDYSKWDHFHDSSSDEDEEDARALPHVTKLDSGTRVSFGRGGVSFQPAAKPPDAAAAAAAESAKQKSIVEKRHAELTRNGGEEESHLWSQTREDVHVAVFVPRDTRARDVSVVLTPKPPPSAPVRHPHLTVRVRGAVVLDDDVAYPFDDDEDELDDCYELQDYDDTRRVCIVEMRKVHVAGAMDSVVLWWDQALVGDSIRDVKDFVDADHSAAGEERKRKWAETWEEAHRMFREKVQAQQPVVIDNGIDD